ncbi:MAG: hypothetical protein ABI760_11360 [Ferruginibacter sp.]
MSYDLYCYKSHLGRPDLKEAQTLYEVDELEDENEIESDPGAKLKITEALLDFNPRLESFDFDYNVIAELRKISVDEEKEQFDYIELNTPEGDLATQITIFDNSVSITIPYWYSGDKAKDVFNKINQYTKIIRQTAGYFVYDPQSENVYDPMVDRFNGLSIYTNMTGEVEKLKTEKTESIHKKPWWKFW